MATKVSLGERLNVEFDGGVDGEGKQIVKRKRFDLIPGATEDAIYDCANKLAALVEHPLLQIEKQEYYELQA